MLILVLVLEIEGTGRLQAQFVEDRFRLSRRPARCIKIDQPEGVPAHLIYKKELY
jgi:hypothetical protein